MSLKTQLRWITVSSEGGKERTAISSQKEVYRRIADAIEGREPLIRFRRLSCERSLMKRASFWCGRFRFLREASLAEGPSLLKEGARPNDFSSWQRSGLSVLAFLEASVTAIAKVSEEKRKRERTSCDVLVRVFGKNGASGPHMARISPMRLAPAKVDSEIDEGGWRDPPVGSSLSY